MATTTYGTPYVSGTDLVANWPAASLTVANSIDSAGYYIGRGINAQVASYTAVLTDAGKTITMTAAGANTVTIPANASVAFVVGSRINILNLGAGACTPTAGAGVTISGTITALAINESAALIKTATNTWSYMVAATPVTPGLSLVTPTSVAGTGVTLSGAVVSMSASTTVSVNGCFTATYNNYVVIFSFTSTQNADIPARLRASGTDSSASYNMLCRGYTFSSGAISTIDFSSGANAFVIISQGANEKIGGEINFISPFIAEVTTGYGAASRNSLHSRYGFAHTLATSYDGFSINPSAGTMTGNLRVYGLRNS